MKQKRTLPWTLLSKYRAPLMGIAMIGVYLTHYKKSFAVNHVSPVPWLVMQMRYGSSGVDIFLILSGLGLCYSFAKDGNLFSFYRKRLVRLLPAYLISEAIFFVMTWITTGTVNIRLFWEKFFFIRFFTVGDAAFWFVIAILVCYLIFPFLYRMMRLTKNCVVNLIICIGLYVIFHELLWYFNPALYTNTIALVQRIPAFIFGVWIGRECLEQKEFPIIFIPLFWLISVAFLLRSKIPFFPRTHVTLYDFSLTFVGMSLILFFILIFAVLEKKVFMKGCIRFLSFLGSITLECYLMHSLFKLYFFSPVDPLLYLVTCCILPTIAAWVLHLVCTGAWKKKGNS